MKNYKVEFIQSIKYVIDVRAKDEDQAIKEAREIWGSIDGTEHYYEVGDPILDVGCVYDVTNTDDPFNP